MAGEAFMTTLANNLVKNMHEIKVQLCYIYCWLGNFCWQNQVIWIGIKAIRKYVQIFPHPDLAMQIIMNNLLFVIEILTVIILLETIIEIIKF